MPRYRGDEGNWRHEEVGYNFHGKCIRPLLHNESNKKTGGRPTPPIIETVNREICWQVTSSMKKLNR